MAKVYVFNYMDEKLERPLNEEVVFQGTNSDCLRWAKENVSPHIDDLGQIHFTDDPLPGEWLKGRIV